MKSYTCCLIIILSFATAAQAEINEVEAWTLSKFKELINIKKVRYMEQSLGKDVVFPGWEGFETKEYTYREENAQGEYKEAKVIMLNATPEKLTRWVMTSLERISPPATIKDAKFLCEAINKASNAQFPVAGIVYEPSSSKPGTEYPMQFRHGVSVALEGCKPPMTPEKVAAAIDPNTKLVKLEDGQRDTGDYGRICSTTRLEYSRYTGIPIKELEGVKWLDAVRKAYQEAWRSDENKLITAWYKARR